jgi:hypothetical protein
MKVVGIGQRAWQSNDIIVHVPVYLHASAPRVTLVAKCIVGLGAEVSHASVWMVVARVKKIDIHELFPDVMHGSLF